MMRAPATDRQRCVLIVLHTLAAEGCPQLALQLAGHWLRQGLAVDLLTLEPEPTDLKAEFEALGVPIESLHLGRGLARYLRLAWLTHRHCRRRRPSAVLSFPLGWHAPIAAGARSAGVRRVCAHVGNLPPVWTGTAFRHFRLLVQLGRPFTSRLLCCSEYIRNATVRDFGLTPRETRTVYNACDLHRCISVAEAEDAASSVRRNTRWPKRTPARLGMVARLECHKDHSTLLKAVALLRDQGVPVELWLIGEGSERPHLEALIAQLNLAEQVELFGTRRDIPELLTQLDLFVFAARPDEGFGIALAEAMAAGIPIVASNVGACREVLEDGRCGLLVDPGCPTALAEGIRTALDDPQATANRKARAAQRARNDFSIEAMAAAYANELKLQP